MRKRLYGVSFTEKIKRVAYVKATSEREAERLFLEGKGKIVDSFDEVSEEADIHDVFEVEDEQW